jgi:hypothetical protein
MFAEEKPFLQTLPLERIPPGKSILFVGFER